MQDQSQHPHHPHHTELLLYLSPTFRAELKPFELDTDDDAPTALEKSTVASFFLRMMTDSAPYIVHTFDAVSQTVYTDVLHHFYGRRLLRHCRFDA
jgi:hypothetical protein